MDLYIPNAVTSVTIDVFAPTNYSDILSVCDVRIVSKGENYKCWNTEKIFNEEFKSTTGKTNKRGRLRFGEIINKGAREMDNDINANRISIEIVALVTYDESFIDKDYWLGCAVDIGGNQIWTGELLFTVKNISVHSMVCIYENYDLSDFFYIFSPKHQYLS